MLRVTGRDGRATLPPRSSHAGGALNILVEGGKPRLEANPSAAEKAHLTIDAKLFRAATIVGKNC